MNNISPLNFFQHGNFIIEKCVFLNNIGYAGGAIYYYETNSYYIYIYLNNKIIIDTYKPLITKSNFSNNRATSRGGVLYNVAVIANFSQDNFCFNNSAFYGNNVASYAIRLSLKIISPNQKILYDSLKQNQILFNLTHELPGKNMKNILHFEALDHFNQTVKSVNG